MRDNVKEFFDSIASNWDMMEEKSPEDILSLLKQIGIKEGDRLLDVACGTGVITGLLHELSKQEVEAIDLSPKMIEIARKKYQDRSWAHFECVDLLEYQPSNKFDVIVIYNAYPHFLNPESLSQKASSILKEGGTLAVLHSLGREELSRHHSGERVHPISRDLDSPEKEYLHFEKEFEALKEEESENHYFLFLKKR